MKTLIFTCITALMLINSIPAKASLDWNKGILTNADGLYRHVSAIAYDPGGSIYVAGIEEFSSGNQLIVIKKYSSTGVLLFSKTNSYIIPAGTVISDGVFSISIDASGNVYVLGTQFGTATRKNDIVLLKYNSSLSLQWRRLIYNEAYPTAQFNEAACKMLFDASGNIYVSGTWYSGATSDNTQIFVRKYTTAGTQVYNTAIAESSINIHENASDMGIDNSLNVTVVARTIVSGVNKIVYARVNSTGGVSWIKYCDAAVNYAFIYNPQIETTPAGTFYISSVLWRVGSPSPYYSKITISKFSSLGIRNWERFTPELSCYPNEVTLRLDASSNIYAGYDYFGTLGSGPNKYSLFKYNSAGTLLWNLVNTEAYSQYFTFETYSSTALFLSYYDPATGDPKIRKIDATNGSTIWTESITVAIPAGYGSGYAAARAIAVHQTTSEVAYCGQISGLTVAPQYATENRWNIRKYGATSPRLSFTEPLLTTNESEISVITFPNPATDQINIRYEGDELPLCISLYDVQGRLLKKISVTNVSAYTIPASDFPKGIISIHSEFRSRTFVSKIILQ